MVRVNTIFSIALVCVAGLFSVLSARDPTVAVVVIVVCGYICLLTLVPKTKISGIAVTLSIFSAALFPTFGSPAGLRLSAILGCTLINLVSISLRKDRSPWTWPVKLFIGFFFLKAIYSLEFGLTDSAVSGISVITWLVSLVLVCKDLNGSEQITVLRFLVLIGTIESCWALLELFNAASPLWNYLGASENNLEARTNYLAPFLPGRAMGTMAQPVPLGFVCSVCSIILLFAPEVVRIRAVKIVLLLLFLSGLIASGTRTAAISLLIACLITYIVGANYEKFLKRFLAAAVGCLASILLLDLGHLLGLNDITTTLSYTHRVGSIQALPQLLELPIRQILFGMGVSGAAELQQGGILNSDGFGAIDNQIVSLIVTYGLFGLSFVGLAIGLSLWGKESNRIGKAMLWFSLFMFLSFEVLSWSSSAVILIISMFALQHRFPEPNLELRRMDSGHKRQDRLILTINDRNL